MPFIRLWVLHPCQALDLISAADSTHCWQIAQWHPCCTIVVHDWNRHPCCTIVVHNWNRQVLGPCLLAALHTIQMQQLLGGQLGLLNRMP
jgi:hypothetical protein